MAVLPEGSQKGKSSHDDEYKRKGESQHMLRKKTNSQRSIRFLHGWSVNTFGGFSKNHTDYWYIFLRVTGHTFEPSRQRKYSQDAKERTYLPLVRGFEGSLLFKTPNNVLFWIWKIENRKLTLKNYNLHPGNAPESKIDALSGIGTRFSC